MIYLIDDNQNNQRLNFYNISFVEEGTFKEYLTPIERLEKREKASDISHLAFLQKADCILLHSTTEDWDNEKGFLKGSTSNVTKIKELIAEEGDKIPLVLFSNSMGEPVYSYKENPNFIKEIKKNFFYERLYDFVEYYKNTNKIELRILAWGRNYRAKEASSLAGILLGTIAFQNEMDKFKVAQLSDKQHVFKSFIEMSLPTANYADILNDLEKNPISISEFRNKINLITESFLEYGKNIYPWK
jgi:hypothetical protein